MRVRGKFAMVGTVVLAMGAFGALAVPANAQEDGVAFEEVGAHEFVVPADVCAITVDAYGAQGGAGEVEEYDEELFNQFAPGLGGRTTATIAVTPGETLDVAVGGAGGDATEGAAGHGGVNGGGDGGSAEGDYAGGGGGGASGVARPTGALVVAGGGGGSANGYTDGDANGVGGHGGEIGTDGGSGGPNEWDGQGGLAGGNGGLGGAAGSPELEGGDGSPGQGGDAGLGLVGAGGGGGGVVGGGAGGGGGEAAGGGGGGGSSAGPAGTVYETGVGEGDGVVILEWDVEPGCGDVAPADVVQTAPRFTG